eukprot:6185224-Pleurochrysis_carterae.AAC.1
MHVQDSVFAIAGTSCVACASSAHAVSRQSFLPSCPPRAAFDEVRHRCAQPRLLSLRQVRVWELEDEGDSGRSAMPWRLALDFGAAHDKPNAHRRQPKRDGQRSA